MLRLFSSQMILLAALMAVAACAPPAPSPTAPPAKPAEAKPPSASPAAKPAEKPAASPAPKAEAKPPPEWDQVLAAAKREGKVVVAGPTQADVRAAITTPFEQKYGITVDYTGHAGRDWSPRVINEREAGQFLWDIYFGGTTTGFTTMIPIGAYDPIEPALILPEVKDTKNWRDGKLDIVDPGRTLLVMTPFQRGTIFVNPSIVDPNQFRSYKDLLDPRWKGKIVSNDPRGPGPGQATFTHFFLHPELGPDFIRELAKQELVFLRNFRQEVDAVGQGRFEVLIGTADATAIEQAQQGVPVVIVPPTQLREGSDISPAEGAVALMNRAPNPNAAKVYLNWLLSQEGQALYARASGFVSARLDVPTDHAPAWRVPQPGAVKTYDQKAMDVRAQVVVLLEEVFGKP